MGHGGETRNRGGEVEGGLGIGRKERRIGMRRKGAGRERERKGT